MNVPKCTLLEIAVQAYNFGNFDYEIRVEGEGQESGHGPNFLGWFWVHAHNFTLVRARSKTGPNTNIFTKRARALILTPIDLASECTICKD